MRGISRRSFMQVAGLGALNVVSPAVLAQAIASCAAGNLFLTFDIVVMPSRASHDECGTDQSGLWLVVRPMIFVNSTAPGTDDGLTAYRQSLDTGKDLYPVLWNCPCTVSSTATLVPMHVNLPSSWQLLLVAYDAQGAQIDGLRKRIDRASRLKVLDWDALELANRPPIPGLPTRPEKRSDFASSANGSPYAAVFNRQLQAALAPKTGAAASDAESQMRVLGQTDLALSHGTRRYIRPDTTVKWNADDGLMILRRSEDGLIETNTHSLLGLAMRLDAGPTAADLARVARLGLAFSDDAESPPKLLATPSESLPTGWCDTNVASDLTALPLIFQRYAAARKNCSSLKGSWDPDAADNSTQPLLNKSLIAGRVLHAAKRIGTHPEDAADKPRRSICIPSGDSRANTARGPLRGLIWFRDRSPDSAPPKSEAKMSGAVHNAWVFRASPYRKFCSFGTGRVYQLHVREYDRTSFLSTLETWRHDDAGAVTGEHRLSKSGDLSEFVWLLPGDLSPDTTSALNGSLLLLRRLPWDDATDKFPEQLLLLTLKDLQVTDVYLMARKPSAQGVFENDAETLKKVYSAPSDDLASKTSAWTSSWLIPTVGVDLAPTIVAVVDTSAGDGDASRLHFEFRDDVNLRMAQSQSNVLGRLRVSHACRTPEETAREALLGDRRTFVALNLYEDSDPSGAAPVEGAFLKDPILQNPPSRLRWLNPFAEMYPIFQKPDQIALQCDSGSGAACAIESSYWFQIKEPFEFGPEQLKGIADATERAAPAIESDAVGAIEDPFQIEQAADSRQRALIIKLKPGISPIEAQGYIRKFFQQTYARASQGTRTLAFRAEGTFGTETDIGFEAAATRQKVNTTADWPVANAALVWSSSRPDTATPTPQQGESAGTPFVRASWSEKMVLTIDLDERLLTPRPQSLSTEFAACLEAWRAIGEIAAITPANARIVISAYRFDRHLSNDSTDGSPGFDRKRLAADAIGALADLSKSIQQRCRDLISGTAAPSSSVKRFQTPQINQPDVRRAHALSIEIELVREAALAPQTAADPVRAPWMDWRVGYPGATAMAVAAAGQAIPNPDSIVAAAPRSPLDNRKKTYLEERSRTTALVPRWPRLPDAASTADQNVRNVYARAFADFLRANNRSIPGASEWHVLTPSKAMAESSVNAQPLIIPLVFRAPLNVASQAWTESLKGYGVKVIEDAFGATPFLAVERLAQALQVMIDGESCTDRPSKQALLLKLHAAGVTLNSLIDGLAGLIWPAFDADSVVFDQELPDSAQQRVRERIRSLQDDASPERKAVVGWCRLALREDPGFFRQCRAILYLEASNESAPLPSDFSQMVVGLRYQSQSSEDSKAVTRRNFTVTAPIEDRLRWEKAPELNERIASIIPLTDSHIESQIEVLWLRAERFEGRLQSFVLQNGVKNADIGNRAFSEIQDVPSDRLAIPARWRADSWVLPLPARAPVGTLRVAYAGIPQSDLPAKWPAYLVTPAILKGIVSSQSGPPATLAYYVTSSHERRVDLHNDQYVVRYVLEIEGDASEALRADTLHISFADDSSPTSPPPPPPNADVNAPLSRLLRIADFRKYSDLESLVCTSILNANNEYAVESVLKSPWISLSASTTSKSTYDRCEWPCVALASISTAKIPSDKVVAPDVVRCALYKKGATAASSSDPPAFLFVVEVLLTRWKMKSVRFQQVRNGLASTTSEESRFNGVFQTAGREALAIIVPAEGAEVDAKLSQPASIPVLPARSVSASALLKAIASQLQLSEPANAQQYALSITFSHAQQLAMNDFLLEPTDKQVFLGGAAYVPLKQGHWVLDGQLPGITDGYDKKILVIGGAEDVGVRNLAIDLEWRNKRNATLLRINHVRIDLK